MDPETGRNRPLFPVAGQGQATASSGPQSLKRWRRRSALRLTPAVVTRLILAWSLLSLALAPFLDYPLIGAGGAVFALLYLGLLFLFPRLWLYAIPLAAVFPDFASYTGREFYTLLDLVVLVTIAGSLCFNRYHFQVLRPSPAVLGIEILLVFSLIGYGAWHTFVAPPGALTSAPWSASANAYMAVKGMLWALLLMPVYGHAMSRNKAATTRDLVAGCTAAACLLLIVGAAEFIASNTAGQAAPAAALYATSAYLGHYAGTPGALALLLIPLVLYNAVHQSGLLPVACGVVIANGLLLFLNGQPLALAATAATVLIYLGLESLAPALRRRCTQTALLTLPAIALLFVASVLAPGKVTAPDAAAPISAPPAAEASTVLGLLFGHGAGAIQQRDSRSFADIDIADQDGKSLLQLHPASAPELRSLIGQRIRLDSDDPYTLAFNARADEPARLAFLLCDGLPRQSRHNPQNCHLTEWALEGLPGQMNRYSAELEVADITAALPGGKRPNLLLLRNDSQGAAITLDSVAFITDELNVLRNSSFTDAFDLWLHHAPGRLGIGSNLYADLLYEAGALSVATLLGLLLLSLNRAYGARSASSLAPAFAAAACGIALLGLFASPLLSPRVALLFYAFLFANLIALRPLRADA
ncbi:hypothetical protein [Parahaliea mediterranea]|uniref:hypothetical protein n=1 Tax=Parahaliea mediterranea TaxID=651086 RepID=UPI0013004565|nr:hypothetical protein [Parahaliea mediterranea]